MLLKFWGVRGSIASPIKAPQIREKIIEALKIAAEQEIDLGDEKEVARYVDSLSHLVTGTVGGNTTCVSVETEEGMIVFDAGTGMRELGAHLMSENRCGEEIVLFFTHTHWDHIQGFPFFTPALINQDEIHIYHIHPHVPRTLEAQMNSPFFPIALSDMQTKFRFHQICEGEEVSLLGVRITSKALHHPGGAFSYRLDSDNASIVIATDGEYQDLTKASTAQFIEFYKGADLLIFDSQYTVRQAIINEDWGHSSSIIGAHIAREAGVKTLALFHHDPAASDEEIYKMLADTKTYLRQNRSEKPSPEIIIAHEGLEIDLWPETRFDIQKSTIDDIVVLKLYGELDANAATVFSEKINEVTEDSFHKVIIDMSYLTDMDIAGVRVLNEARAQSYSLALADLSENVLGVLDLAGLRDWFAIYDDLYVALAVMKAQTNGDYQLLEAEDSDNTA